MENLVGRAIHELGTRSMPLQPGAAAELREAAVRVLISRRFYNDAVRDTQALRARRMPRALGALHLAGRRGLPEFFDIDDTLPAAPDPAPRNATLDAPVKVEPAPDAPEPQTVVPGSMRGDGQ